MSITFEQAHWWEKFKAIVKAMPKDMEVIIRSGGDMSACPKGALQNDLENDGDGGRAEVLGLPSFTHPRMLANSESL